MNRQDGFADAAAAMAASTQAPAEKGRRGEWSSRNGAVYPR